ncbi:hypothetical protein KTE57_27175, partial [Burkholderia multivorans]|uniref:hypothetical protein n=1 Tax=Burkholderia multivorans TaxID=87883 RepID=UPI001C241D41
GEALKRIESYIELGVQEGAQLVVDGRVAARGSRAAATAGRGASTRRAAPCPSHERFARTV